MRQVQFYGAISLDGYLATAQHDLQWLFDTAGGDKANSDQFFKQVDTTIMGRKTYEVTKNTMGDELLFPDKTNYVLSRTREGQTRDATYMNQSPVDLVRHLQAQSGGNIWIVGGGQIVTDLVAEDLIDEWWIQIAPVLLGKGIRLFPEGDCMTGLNLKAVARYDQLAELYFKRNSKQV
ncbi:dihydrofolate reductase family protein [Pediococcus ethanolidurans]|uniref:Reductase n=1 Tax=Pediococcus ethanolidurans TaxID=319653 RepID=A0A0R2K1A6_9LACO|nr:dihydrofolate reductase family protein [Pediococcus ethanolidurans]KRN83392.1 reductase [Pediococcus ethanolidurans]GEN94508.1 dihydrofolate reductase [Pediococcus ethanolidurans]SER22773.1 Dihydrofolate reductase [Pediococcus ethanolidurans]